MVNLLRFAVDGGRERYAEYVQHLRLTAAPFGADVLHVGTGSTVLIADPAQQWDAVLMVRYPTRQAFADLVHDPGFQAGGHLRSSALTETVLQATVPSA